MEGVAVSSPSAVPGGTVGATAGAARRAAAARRRSCGLGRTPPPRTWRAPSSPRRSSGGRRRRGSPTLRPGASGGGQIRHGASGHCDARAHAGRCAARGCSQPARESGGGAGGRASSARERAAERRRVSTFSSLSPLGGSCSGAQERTNWLCGPRAWTAQTGRASGGGEPPSRRRGDAARGSLRARGVVWLCERERMREAGRNRNGWEGTRRPSGGSSAQHPNW